MLEQGDEDMQTTARSDDNRPIHVAGITPAHIFHRPQPLTLLKPDTEVYAQGEKSGTLYNIEYGAVRLYRLLADGRRQVIAFYLAGETFGFEADGTHCFFAETLVHTALRMIERPVDAQSPELVTLALRCMVRAQQHLLVVGRQNAAERLAAFLIDMTERQGDLGQIDLPMTRADIGDYLGMTIETVSRGLSKFRSQGIIRLISNRSVEILKPEKLAALCG